MAAVITVSSVKVDRVVNRGNSFVLIGRASKTEPITSPAIEPSKLTSLFPESHRYHPDRNPNPYSDSDQPAHKGILHTNLLIDLAWVKVF
jgi:hypothetical protein